MNERGIPAAAVFAVLVALVGAGASVGPAAGAMVCFPTCDVTDGRFLSLAGAGFNTLAGDAIDLALAAPGSAADLQFGIFDGDTSSVTSGNWDFFFGAPVFLDFTLFADPMADGTGDVVLWQASGAVMPDNAWFDVTLPNSPLARGGNGNYFYRLEVSNPDPAAVTRSNFKIRATNLFLRPQAFSFEGVLLAFADFPILYPDGFPGPSTYDGNWTFFFEVPTTVDYVLNYDGDLDHGTRDCSVVDTDDPDTSNLVLPPFAVGTAAVLEGIAKGDASGSAACLPLGGRSTASPPDDYFPGAFVRPPSIVYDIVDPLAGGTVYPNGNPSGNREWEQHRISSETGCVAGVNADFCVAGPLPRGIWQARVKGVDLSNLNAWRFEFCVLGVDEEGEPVPKLQPDVGTGTPGYWKNHPDAWPVDEIVIGGVAYSRADAIGLLKSGDGDKSLTLFRATVSATLNALIGNDTTCVDATLAAANDWLAIYPPDSKVKGRSDAWKVGEPLYLELDAYNNGRLCAPHRD